MYTESFLVLSESEKSSIWNIWEIRGVNRVGAEILLQESYLYKATRDSM